MAGRLRARENTWKPLRFSPSDIWIGARIRQRHAPIRRRGLRRPTLGEDPQEARAVPKEQVYGSLPERILYKELLRRRIDFSFQSSMSGGHQQWGGMLIDFVLTVPNVAIRVQSIYYHTGVIARARDIMQQGILESQGLAVWDIWDYEILNPELFREWGNRNLGRLTA